MSEVADVRIQEDRWIDVPAVYGEHEVDAAIQLRVGTDGGGVLVKTMGGAEVQTSLIQLRRGLRLVEEEQAR
jgi:hypothetical protein